MVACDFSRWIFFTNISIVLTLAAVQKIKYHSISNRISLKLLLSIFLYFIIKLYVCQNIN
jgi:Flp pilus assembly protein protease CpaA